MNAEPGDFAAWAGSPASFNLALLNILDDSADERSRMDDTQRAMLNLLDDSAGEGRYLAETQAAVLNMLEDAAAERERVNQTQLAVLNIFDDLEAEKARTEATNADLVREVAEHERAERSLHDRTDELVRSNADLEIFAYVASHDLSEPLRAISGPISLLARRYQGRLDADADQYIGFAVDGCQRMQTLIDDLLTYSRVGRLEGPIAPVDLNRLLDGVLAGLSRAVEEKGATITLGQLPVVAGEATQLAQVFQNLIGNALKFSGAGAPAVEVAAERGEGAWRLSVTDNGIGIAPQHRERIFGLFKRLHTREEYPGTGMGLALAKRIVEHHGGVIGVDGAPSGRGCRFWFTLPDRQEVPA